VNSVSGLIKDLKPQGLRSLFPNGKSDTGLQRRIAPTNRKISNSGQGFFNGELVEVIVSACNLIESPKLSTWGFDGV
jgi:hypothetical protein